MNKIISYIIVSGCDRPNMEGLVMDFLTEEPMFELYGYPFAGKEYDEDKKEWVDCIYQAMVRYEHL